MVDVLAFAYADLEEIGTGDEGTVYRYLPDPDFVVKYLHSPPADLRERVAAMLALEPARWGGREDATDHLFISWPLAVATFDFDDDNGRISGIVSPAVKEPRALVELLENRTVPRLLPHAREWVGVAQQIAATTARLHALSADVVVGDYSKRNILLTYGRTPTFVDADSMQFTAGGRLYRATRHTEEYSPPEYLAGGAYSKEGDRFGLAVLIIELLLGGDHPYAGATRDGAPTIPDNIRDNRNRVTTPTSLLPAPGRLPAAQVLPPEVFELASEALGPGFSNPALRPSAQRWSDVLRRLHADLRQCQRLDTHQYSKRAAVCPYCQIEADPFPSAKPAKAAAKTSSKHGSQAFEAPEATAPTPPPPVSVKPAVAQRPTAAADSSARKWVAVLVATVVIIVILKVLGVF